MQPRQMRETSRPVRPSFTYSIMYARKLRRSSRKPWSISPVSKAAGSPLPPGVDITKTPAHQQNAKHKRILILEDNRLNSKLLKQLLTAYGYKVWESPEGSRQVGRCKRIRRSCLSCGRGHPSQNPQYSRCSAIMPVGMVSDRQRPTWSSTRERADRRRSAEPPTIGCCSRLGNWLCLWRRSPRT